MPTLSDLKMVNRRVNDQVQYHTDIELYDKPELWVVADRVGDCEDCALAKRQALIARAFGIPVLCT